jgi:5-dehydro-2-deoxygluconokinase
MCQRTGTSLEHIPYFKRLALSAAMMTADGRGDGGILLDGRFGQEALDQATGKGLWIGRPVEQPGSRPLRFEGGADLGCTLREWPAEHCVKCLVFYHPDDPKELCAEQERQVVILADACRRTGHDLLLEVIPGKSEVPVDERTLARAMHRFYELGVCPDWWKLPHPGSDAAWSSIASAIAEQDPHCRGVLLLGLDAPENELFAAFAMSRRHPVCKGFAVGRTIFGKPAEDWLAGRINDQQAIQAMAAGYRRLIDAWESAA